MKALIAALTLTACSAPVATAQTIPPRITEHDTTEVVVTVPETSEEDRGEHLHLRTPRPAPYVAFDGARCPQWHETAMDVGWHLSEIERLDHILWRESRCEPTAHNRADPQTGSRGLVQINGFWCRRNRYEPNPAGFLGALNILEHCDDLFDPTVNLLAARAIFTYQVNSGRCGWLPWTTRQTRWC